MTYGKHCYVTKNGELYVGATTISEAWDKSYFLAPWTAKEMANEILSTPYDAVMKMSPPDFEKFILNAKGAARRKGDLAKENGTLAHAWISSVIKSHLNDDEQILPTPDSVEAKNAINAFSMFAKRSKITWLATEEVVSSDKHKIAGTLDAIGSEDGLTGLYDIKTSSQISSSYLLQLALYDLMLKEMGLTVAFWKVVRTPKDGLPAETLTITNKTDMEFFRETALKQREAHKFYVYAGNKLRDEKTNKIKVDK